MKRLWISVAAILGVLVLIQFVPYGRNHANPAVRREPAWNAPATRQIAQRTCFDCHSNETRWPWYAHVAPVSWYLQRHVTEGREKFNFSEWGRVQKTKEAVEVVAKAEMPPWSYRLAHSDARLNAAERQTFIAGLQATLKGAGGSERKRDGEAGERE